jgi:photosystem II stability/assembly factor-like uncharacterized protein
MKRAPSDAMSSLAQANPLRDDLNWWTASEEDALLDALLAYETPYEPNQSDTLSGRSGPRRGTKRAAATGLRGQLSPTHLVPGAGNHDEDQPDTLQLIADGRHVCLYPDATDAEGADVSHSPGTGDQPRHRGLIAFSMGAAAVLLVAGLLVFSYGNGPSLPITTSWHDGHVFPGGSKTGRHMAGTWRLVDDLLSGTWQQNLSGPPPGYIDCPTISVCYAMSGHYLNADAGAQLLSESLYVTDDVGKSWSVLPMPNGFAPTSSISCASADTCASGGTYRGRSVFMTTSNGGHTFTIDPLPQGIGTLGALSCPSMQVCRGLATTSSEGNNDSIDSTLLSTNDGGATFTERLLMRGLYMPSIACSSGLQCTVVGTNGASGSTGDPGIAALTTDDGARWSAGAFPTGFDFPTQLSCADALDCSVIGAIGTSGAPTLAPNLASTTNGGESWALDPIPADVPGPTFTGLSCPSPKECWASGSESVSQQIGNTTDGGSSMFLGTTDRGATWSKVTFSVPQDAPNHDGQSFRSIGLISCATANVCVALGAAAQGSPRAPVYSLVVP